MSPFALGQPGLGPSRPGELVGFNCSRSGGIRSPQGGSGSTPRSTLPPAMPGGDGQRPRRPPDVHQAGAAGDQRRGQAGRADDPRGVLAAVVRPGPRAQGRRPRPRPRGVPVLLQRGSGPHRAAAPGSASLAGSDRRLEDEATMTERRRSSSGAVHLGGAHQALMRTYSDRAFREGSFAPPGASSGYARVLRQKLRQMPQQAAELPPLLGAVQRHPA